MPTPGALIRDARRRHRLSQARLALRAGTTQAAISRIERGEVSPSVDTLGRLLRAMGEELALSSEHVAADVDPVHLAAERRLSPARRLERALAWTTLNDEVRAAGARARR